MNSNTRNKTPLVYIIEQHGSEKIKIGVTDDPARRLAQLQRQNPDRIAIRYLLTPAQGVTAYELEGVLHSHFNSARGYGEWFAATPEAIIDDLRDGFLASFVDHIDTYPRWEFHEKPFEPATVDQVVYYATITAAFLLSLGWTASALRLWAGGEAFRDWEIALYGFAFVASIAGLILMAYIWINELRDWLAKKP